MLDHVAQPQQQRGAGLFDRTAVRVNQAAIVTLLVLGFLLDLPWLASLVGAVMAIGTIWPGAALFQRLYRDLLRPAGLLKPDLHQEEAAPHRFAQGVGAAFLIIATIAFVVGAAVVGWGLALVVALLASINLVFGFCAGCFMYFQLQRLQRTRSSS